MIMLQNKLKEAAKEAYKENAMLGTLLEDLANGKVLRVVNASPTHKTILLELEYDGTNKEQA